MDSQFSYYFVVLVKKKFSRVPTVRTIVKIIIIIIIIIIIMF